jgi:ribosomal protein S18 acetylase RimI-like enzyme
MAGDGDWSVRAATAHDASDIVVLIDIASRGLLTALWSLLASPGQSALEIGRERIMSRPDLPSHLSNWHLAERLSGIIGGYAGYRVPTPYDPGDVGGLPDFYGPMLELEALAAGTWHLVSLAVYAEERGAGIGSRLLDHATQAARAAGCASMTIMANSSNAGACRLYLRHGFREKARRPSVPFEGSSDRGDWILFERRI